MLNILINDNSSKVLAKEHKYESYVSDYFDDEYEDDWFKDEYVKKLIKEVDDTDVLADGTLHNKYLGGIVKSQLSSGVKGLILLYKTDCKINGDRLGDNCWKYVMEIAKNKDIYIIIKHIPEFPDDFEAYLENYDKIVDRTEYIYSYVRLVG